MNKEQLIQEIKNAIQQNQLSESEVLALYKEVSPKSEKGSMVSKILYAAGGIVAVVGVWVLLLQIWDDIGSGLRIALTIGSALIAYVGAYFFSKNQEQDVLSQILFVVSAVIAPVALYTTATELSILPDNAATAAMLVSGISALIFGTALYITKKPLLQLAVVSFVSWFYFALIAKLVEGSGLSFSAITDVTVYASMLLGIAIYAYTSLISSNVRNKTIVSLFIFASYALVLMSALFLGGVWNLLYAFLLVGAVTLAVKIKRTSALVVSSVAIVFYLLKISSKYFADSLGWAVILILAGFAIIAVGYFTYALNKRYILKP